MDERLDLYTDYLLSSAGHTTATGLSRLLDGYLSHDQITRLLSGNEFTSKDLWHEVKPLVRSYETDEACLIFDDTIISKPYMDENEIICRRWDHSHGRNEKGINLLTAFYYSQPLYASEALRVPVSYECVQKTVHYCDLKTRQEKR
ncbi:MAG: IS701 family transposase, partial [Planctomycetaceae bacterium]|nr:IS701 family transposase [Planctomycetaceae bacterium]